MSYIAKDPENYLGQVVGTGACVVFVQKVTGAPVAALWKEGSKVNGTEIIPSGTAIATFVKGQYPNLPKGNHAAIFISKDAKNNCIWVYDQWKGQPVHKRPIYFKKGKIISLSDDANAFSVIE